MALADGYRKNFETLQRAFLSGDVALMECQAVATGETTAVICAANHHDDGSVEFVPFATFSSSNINPGPWIVIP